MSEGHGEERVTQEKLAAGRWFQLEHLREGRMGGGVVRQH